ncbi:uncharacterized protein LOC130282580 [Hyla sarda]|uniref:uncharacterized protein LOC130282580 n=1 Tax=Hyla sarda TaxID=327740 RepID=UPI0024C3BE02|nr:uncharacterized protein LOC130282580 [Hyla sarda]
MHFLGRGSTVHTVTQFFLSSGRPSTCSSRERQWGRLVRPHMPIFSWGCEKVQFWGRYIDDILNIWQGTSIELEKFISRLNCNSINIKLTHSIGKPSIDFLDIKIDVDEQVFITTDLFRKQTAANMVLHATSAHPRHLINNIPAGQYIRARRICSNDVNFEKQAKDLQVRFQEWGYSGQCLKRAYKRAKMSSRDVLLQGKKKNIAHPDNENMIRLIVDHHSRTSEVHQFLGKYWPILLSDPILASHLPDKPSLTYRRSKNLKDLLVHSYHRGTTPSNAFASKGPKWGTYTCGHCVACKNIVKSETFANFDNSKEYRITHRIDCATKGVVYLASCPCGKIYVGLTTREFRRRVREHVLDILAAKDVDDIDTLKTLPRHFKIAHGCDSSLLQVRAALIVCILTQGVETGKGL